MLAVTGATRPMYENGHTSYVREQPGKIKKKTYIFLNKLILDFLINLFRLHVNSCPAGQPWCVLTRSLHNTWRVVVALRDEFEVQDAIGLIRVS